MDYWKDVPGIDDLDESEELNLSKENQKKIKKLLIKFKKKEKLSDDEKDALAAFIAFINA